MVGMEPTPFGSGRVFVDIFVHKPFFQTSTPQDTNLLSQAKWLYTGWYQINFGDDPVGLKLDSLDAI